MMKKVLLVVLTLAIATSLSFAQTSGPSNVAGYVKITCNGTTVGSPFATEFGLPFTFWNVDAGVPQYGVESTAPSDIIGDQAAPGGAISSDKVISQIGGGSAYRDNSDPLNIHWVDPLEDNAAMIPGGAYWYINKSGAPRDLVLAGEVSNTTSYGSFFINDPTTANGNWATPYSWRDSRNVPIDQLDLLNQGFTGGGVISSDKVLEQGPGGSALNYILDPVNGDDWDYGFTTLTPGKAYWIINKHMGHEWNYDYVGIPVLPSTANDNEGVITSTKTSTVKTKATVRATTNVKQDTKKAGKKTTRNLK